MPNRPRKRKYMANGEMRQHRKKRRHQGSDKRMGRLFGMSGAGDQEGRDMASEMMQGALSKEMLPELDMLRGVLVPEHQTASKDSSHNGSTTLSTQPHQQPYPLDPSTNILHHFVTYRHLNTLHPAFTSYLAPHTQYAFFSRATMFELGYSKHSVQYLDLIAAQRNEVPSTCLINPHLDRIFLSMSYVYRVFKRDESIVMRDEESMQTNHLPTPPYCNPAQLSHQLNASLNCEQVVDALWQRDKRNLFVGFMGDTSRIVKVKMGGSQWREKGVWTGNASRNNRPASLCSFDVGRHGRLALGLHRSFKILQKGREVFQHYAPFQSDITNIRFLSTNNKAFTTLSRSGEFSVYDMRQKSRCFSHQHWATEKPLEVYHVAQASPFHFAVAFMTGKVALYDCRMSMREATVTVHEPADKPSLLFASLRPILHETFLLHADPARNTLHVFDLTQTATQDMPLFEHSLPSRPVGMNFDTEHERIMCLTEDHNAHWFSWAGSERDC